MGRSKGLPEGLFWEVGGRFVTEELLLSSTLCGQVMSIAEVAHNKDWAAVVRLAQTGPGLNPPRCVRLSPGPDFPPRCRQGKLALAKKPGVLNHPIVAQRAMSSLSACCR